MTNVNLAQLTGKKSLFNKLKKKPSITAQGDFSGRFFVVVKGGEVTLISDLEEYAVVNAEYFSVLMGNVSRLAKQLKWIHGNDSESVFDTTHKVIQKVIWRAGQ